MVRMRDIADQLGISMALLSLALNHKDKGAPCGDDGDVKASKQHRARRQAVERMP